MSIGFMTPLFEFGAEHAVTPAIRFISARRITWSPGFDRGGSKLNSPFGPTPTFIKTFMVVGIMSGVMPYGADRVLHDRKHRPAPIRVQDVALCQVDVVGVVDRPSGRQPFGPIVCSERHQVGHLLAQWVDYL